MSCNTRHVIGDGTSAGVSESIEWSAPTPLEGVKSRKRLLFEVECTDAVTADRTVKVRNIALSLSSRVVAVGAAGSAVADILLNGASCNSKQHKDLKVLHLAPSTISSTEAPSGYACAITAALKQNKPHIVVLSEAKSSQDAEWQNVFNELVHGKCMWKFRGAIVVCAEMENEALQRKCPERWIAESGEIVQRPCFQMSERTMPQGADVLREYAAQLDYCDLLYWIEKAEAGDWTVIRFDAGGGDGLPSLRGLVFYHMIEGAAELHVRFVFVPREHRRMGLGAQLVRSVIERAAHMSQSECRWISLQAAGDELVPWYEKLGFTDMSCGHTDGDFGETRMELQNVSVVCSSS